MNDPIPRDALPTAEKILLAAEEAFAAHGFAGARVDEIARRAGVNKAMLYYHVGGKAILYQRVLAAYFRELAARVGDALADSDEPGEQLVRLQAAFAATAQAHPHFPQIMLREIAGGALHLPREALEGMAGLIATTRRVVESGRRSGVFRRDVDPLVTHILVVGSVVFAANGVRLLERLRAVGIAPPTTHLELGALARAASDIILHGITTPGARP